LLEVSDLEVRFGGLTALDRASLTVAPGSVCGLIGPNGAGKTTLFNAISRLVAPSGGAVRWRGEDLLARRASEIAGLGVARTFQHPALLPSLTVRENVMLGAQHRCRTGFLAAALYRPSAAREERRTVREADELLARLGLEEVAGSRAAGLPYGTLKRVELARALCQAPDLLLLDEPAAGLSQGEIDELAGTLAGLRDELGLALLLVEHHMGLVMRVSDQVVVLDFGRVIAAGAPAVVARDPGVIEAYLGAPA
jgi:branched-chain amino acid transport system ATP-binding protein